MTTKPPNILLITTDQQRYDTIGSRAPRWLRTPHLDMLASEGVTFDRTYAECPVCVAARSSLMTGRYVTSHKLDGNQETSKYFGSTDTLPAVLGAAGYQTAAIGKMHFGPERARHGFQEMLLPADYYRWMERTGNPCQPMRHGLGQNELHPGLATVPEALTLTNWIADQGSDYILHRRDPTKPFFLWCSFSKPHPPLDPPEPYFSMYRDAAIPEPVVGDWAQGDDGPIAFVRQRQQWSSDRLSPELIRAARAAYYGLVTHCDYAMGRILAALQDQWLLNDTLILFTSDHGDYLGDHRSAAKFFYHDASARVPCILRLPKSWDERWHGTVSDTLATHADILPTLASAAGATLPAGIDGLDLRSVLRGERPARQHLHGTFLNGLWQGWIDGTWKFMHYREGGGEQLFDLAKDPLELHDLGRCSAHTAVRDRLRAALTAYLAEHAPGYLRDGQLPVDPPGTDSERDRRAKPWPGLHTEHYHQDVRH